jgi:competence protein ComEC
VSRARRDTAAPSGGVGAAASAVHPAAAATARLVGFWRARAIAALRELRARPWHTGTTALVAGLLLGPRVPAAVPVAALAAPALASRAAVRLALAGAVVAGALVAQARLEAIDATQLTPRIGHAVHARVLLLDAPRERPFGVRVATVRLDGERVLLRAGRGVRWPTERIGAVLAVRGGLAPLPAADAWQRARGVHAQLRADALADTGVRRGGLAGVVDGVRARAQAVLRTGVPPPEAALLRGMALGDDAALPDRTRDEFRASGLSHLVAASGQNVILLAALVLAAAAVLGLALRARLVVVLAAIALYVPLAGSGPSIQRAGIMGAAAVVAVLAGRPAARWHALLLATAGTLALNPRAVEDVGWQLSFAAVVAILLLAARVREGLARRGLPRGLAEATALTGAATLGTAPLIAAHFGQASLVSLPANVLAAPAVAPVMWLAMLAVALGQLGTALAAPFVELASFPVAYVMWVAHVASGLPGAQASVPVGVVGAVCAAAALALTVPRVRAPLALGAVAAVALGCVLSLAQAAGRSAPAGLRITFLDVGQGDATLIQWRRSAILVDTGPPDGPILARLRHAGVRRLDLLVVTHAQADHDGGAAAVLRALPVALLLDGRDGIRDPSGLGMAAQAARRHVRMVAARAGQVLRVGAVVLRVLWPAGARGPADAGADPNQRAIVAEADAGGVRTLLTADAESDVLGGLDLGPVDILKVSHHGSADAGLPALLARLRPRLAAIEAGRHNVYGHPAAATVRALVAAGAAVARTDRDGSVSVEPAAGALRIHSHA